MRDDIHSLLNNLIRYYTEKLELLNQFINKNNACLSYLCSNDLHSLETAIEEDNEIIAKIDLIDFEISKSRSILCEKSGILEKDFQNHFIKKPHNEAEKNLQELINKIGEVLKIVDNGRSLIIHQLDEQMKNLKDDIVTLHEVKKTKDNFPTIH